MKELSNFLQNKLIVESFSWDVLQEIDKQIKADKQAEKEENKKIEDEFKAQGKTLYNWYLKDNFRYASVKRVLSDLNIAWDKLTEDSLDVYESYDTVYTLAKRMASNRSTAFKGFILPVYKDEKHKYQNILISYYFGDLCYYSFLNNYGRRESLKPSSTEIYSFTHNKDVEKYYVLNLTNHPELSTDDLRSQRNKAKSGVIENTANFYKNLADNNRERYRKAAEKLRMKKYADDGINDLVKSYNERCLEYVDKFMLDPIAFCKCEYSIKDLITVCQYLITAYSNYAGYKLSLGSGNSYNFEASGLSESINNIKKYCKLIDRKIEDIESKLITSK